MCIQFLIIVITLWCLISQERKKRDYIRLIENIHIYTKYKTRMRLKMESNMSKLQIFVDILSLTSIFF
jgi:hypothetical protein